MEKYCQHLKDSMLSCVKENKGTFKCRKIINQYEKYCDPKKNY